MNNGDNIGYHEFDDEGDDGVNNTAAAVDDHDHDNDEGALDCFCYLGCFF